MKNKNKHRKTLRKPTTKTKKKHEIASSSSLGAPREDADELTARSGRFEGSEGWKGHGEGGFFLEGKRFLLIIVINSFLSKTFFGIDLFPLFFWVSGSSFFVLRV